MATIKFDDFLKNELKDANFKESYLAEKAILESAIAVYNARKRAGLTQRELASLSHIKAVIHHNFFVKSITLFISKA